MQTQGAPGCGELTPRLFQPQCSIKGYGLQHNHILTYLLTVGDESVGQVYDFVNVNVVNVHVVLVVMKRRQCVQRPREDKASGTHATSQPSGQ